MRVDVDAAFRSALVGKPCLVTRRDHDWDFDFGEGIGVEATVPWRLISSDGIALTRDDHGQWFGLKDPVDAAERASEILRGAMVESVQTDPITADLRVWFSNGIRLEFFNNSGGYEGWHATLESCGVIAMGGGGFSVL